VLQSNEQLPRAAVASFNEPDQRERYLDLYADDVVLNGYPEGLTGKGGAQRFFSALWSAFPAARLTIEHGEEVVARYSLSGQQAEEFCGAPSSDRDATFEGIAWMRVADGHAVDVWHAHSTLDSSPD
jgi:hypothetical protein